MSTNKPGNELPWQWPEETWRGIVGKVRAGRSLKPKAWQDGARCAVALSFDSDHESAPTGSPEAVNQLCQWGDKG